MNDVYVQLTDRQEISQCVLLMQMFYSAHESLNFVIPEIKLLNSFERVSKFPSESFSPRTVITNVLEQYEAHKALQLVSQEYRNNVKLVYDEKSVTVGYKMSIYFDVIYMCCLHCIMCHSVCTRPIKLLLDIMMKKYNLRYDSDNFVKKDSNALTLYRISRSFPTVTINACRKISPAFSAVILSHFPNLPVQLLNPYILDIMPSRNVPAALLIYILIVSKEYLSKKQEAELTLSGYYKIFTVLNKSNLAFPERFKYRMQRKWGIMKKNTMGITDYHKFLAAYNEKAKTLITTLKNDDPELDSILSKLDNQF